MLMFKRIIVIVAIVISGASLFSVATPATAHAQACTGRFLTFPVWYRNLPGSDNCQPRIQGPEHLWIIALNVIETLMQVAAYASGFYVLWGGIQYMLSIGEPAKVASAKSTIQNALIGLVIAMFSVAIVSLVGALA